LKHYKGSQVIPGDPMARYVIVMHKRDAVTVNKDDKRIPEDFEHVIYLPHAFGMQVRDASMKGGSNMIDFIQTLQKP
jgi:hypothetical protein